MSIVHMRRVLATFSVVTVLATVAWHGNVGTALDEPGADRVDATRLALAAIDEARCTGSDERRRFRAELAGFRTPSTAPPTNVATARP